MTRSLVCLVPVAVSLLLWMVGTGSSVLGGLGNVGGQGLALGPSVDSGLSLMGLCGMAFFGMIWFVSLFVGVREVVAEGGVLVEDGAEALMDVHSSIKARVDRRGPEFTVRSGELDDHPIVRVSNDREEALILVRRAGPDLRVAWTMWRMRSTSTLVIDLLSGRRSNDLALLLADSSSAMAELVRDASEYGARPHR